MTQPWQPQPPPSTKTPRWVIALACVTGPLVLIGLASKKSKEREEAVESARSKPAPKTPEMEDVDKKLDAIRRGEPLPRAQPPPPATPPRIVYTTVKCCDGSRSPSCKCGRAKLTGCCSGHGGVCGGCE